MKNVFRLLVLAGSALLTPTAWADSVTITVSFNSTLSSYGPASFLAVAFQSASPGAQGTLSNFSGATLGAVDSTMNATGDLASGVNFLTGAGAYTWPSYYGLADSFFVQAFAAPTTQLSFSFTFNSSPGTPMQLHILLPVGIGFISGPSALIYVDSMNSVTTPQLLSAPGTFNVMTFDPSLTISLAPQTAVPEPATLTLFGSGLAAVAYRARRRKTAAKSTA